MSNQLPKFLLAENNTDAPGAQFIICSETNYIGQVIKGHSDHKLKVSVPGYNIQITLAQYGGEYLDSESHVQKELKAMATFFLTERIARSPKNFEKYKLKE